MPRVGKAMDRKRTKQQAIDAEKAAALTVGQEVDLVLDNGAKMRTRTRSEPWQLGHGAWVVMVEGKTGGWALERVLPVEGRGAESGD
jgi:hypothetical protein